MLPKCCNADGQQKIHITYVPFCFKNLVTNICMFVFYYRHGLANSVVHLLLDCDGSETHVLNCRQFRVSNATCNHLEDIEIICCELLIWSEMSHVYYTFNI